MEAIKKKMGVLKIKAGEAEDRAEALQKEKNELQSQFDAVRNHN